MHPIISHRLLEQLLQLDISGTGITTKNKVQQVREDYIRVISVLLALASLTMMISYCPLTCCPHETAWRVGCLSRCWTFCGAATVHVVSLLCPSPDRHCQAQSPSPSPEAPCFHLTPGARYPRPNTVAGRKWAGPVHRRPSAPRLAAAGICDRTSGLEGGLCRHL